MIKILLNLLLNIILGSLKSVLLKHIESVDAESITNEEKRKTVANNLKADLLVAGKSIGNAVINLAIEAGVNIIKNKVK